MADNAREAGHATLVFDGDCGFCSTSARFIERRIRPIATAVEPWQTLELGPLGLTAEAADRAVQWVSPNGQIHSGAMAVAALLHRAERAPWRWAASVLELPGVRWFAAGVYRAVSANRHRLPGGTPACKLPKTSTNTHQ